MNGARRAPRRLRESEDPVAASIGAGRKWFGAAALAGVGSAIALVVVLFAVASLISTNLDHHESGAGLGWLVVGVVALAGQVIFAAMRSLLAARGAGVVEGELRRRLVGSLFSPGSPPVSSAVASRLLLEESTRVGEASARWEPLRMEVVVVPAVLVAFAFSENWLVGALLLVAAPLIPLNMAVFGMGAKGLSARQANQVSELDQLVLDRIKGADTLRALGAAGRERRTVRDAADELARRTMSVLRVALLSSAALEALVTYAVAVVATYIGLVLLGYVQIRWAPTTLGLRSGLFLLLLAPAFFQPFRDLAAAYHDRQDVTAVTEALSRELGTGLRGPKDAELPGRDTSESSPLRESQPRPITSSSGPLVVRAVGVGLCYPAADAFAVNEVDWRVPRGALAAVAGPSGAGKTTMLRMLTSRLVPSTGTLEVGAKGIAWVSQRPYFFQASIVENLTVARPSATEDDLWDALSRVGLAEVVAAIPDGLATRLGWSGDAFSGGQARRLALARALLCGAELLVLDEPTAHLDPATEESLIETIVALAPQHTIIVASHSPALLARCVPVLRLNVDQAARLTDAR
jgi:ATP-binding cassette, subfamily C, bacterial CydD